MRDAPIRLLLLASCCGLLLAAQSRALDTDTEGFVKTQIGGDPIVEQITPISSATTIADSRNAQGRPSQIAQSRYFVSLSEGRLSARVFASSDFCAASECGVDNWSTYDARAWSMVRMKETLVLTVPAGDYPGGLDVQLPVAVEGVLTASGDSQAAANADYFVQLSRPETFDNRNSGILRVDGLGPSSIVVDEEFVLEVFLVAPGTTLAAPLDVTFTVDAHLGFFNPVSVQGRSAAEQGVAETDLDQSLRLGCLTVPEGVAVASASGVFLEEPCAPAVPGLGGPAFIALSGLLVTVALASRGRGRLGVPSAGA